MALEVAGGAVDGGFEGGAAGDQVRDVEELAVRAGAQEAEEVFRASRAAPVRFPARGVLPGTGS